MYFNYYMEVQNIRKIIHCILLLLLLLFLKQITTIVANVINLFIPSIQMTNNSLFFLVSPLIF